MSVSLKIVGAELRGAFALVVAPGTPAAQRDRLVDRLLTQPLFAAAEELGVVLGADPHCFARPLDGKDEQGRTRFSILGRVEGDRLVPARPSDGRDAKRRGAQSPGAKSH